MEDKKRRDISNKLKEIKINITNLKSKNNKDLLKIDLLEWEYTKLYNQLLKD